MRERPLPRKSTPPCAVWSFTSFRKLTILSVIVVLNTILGTDYVAATAAGGERALLHALQHGLYHSSNATHVDELITSLEKVIWHSRRILKSGNFQEHHVAHTKLEHANLTQASDLTSWARAATAWLGAAMRLQAGDAAAATQQGAGSFGGVAARVSQTRNSHRRWRRHLSSSENVVSTREDDGAEVVGDDGGDSSASRPRQRRMLHGTPAATAAKPQLAAAHVLSAESASAAAGRLLHSSDDSSSGPDAGSSTDGNNSSATSTTAAATPTTQLPVILSFTPEQERLRQGYRQRAGELAPSPWPAQQLTLLVPVMRRLLLAQLLKAWLRDMRQQLPAEPHAAQALAVLIRKLFEVHVGSVVQRAALEYFHISKAGGTSWTVAANDAKRGRWRSRRRQRQLLRWRPALAGAAAAVWREPAAHAPQPPARHHRRPHQPRRRRQRWRGGQRRPELAGECEPAETRGGVFAVAFGNESGGGGGGGRQCRFVGGGTGGGGSGRAWGWVCGVDGFPGAVCGAFRGAVKGKGAGKGNRWRPHGGRGPCGGALRQAVKGVLE